MSEGDRLDVAETSFGGWTVFFLLVSAGTVLFVLANPTGSTTSTVISAVLVAALQVLYWTLARPRLAGIRGDTSRAWAYAAAAIVVFTVAASLNQWAALVLFALTPQIFLLLSPRPATAVILALNLVPLAVRVLTGASAGRDAIQDVGTTAFVITFSLFFATRILAISRQSEERRRLIQQLEEREAEIAALSAARGAEVERARIAREMHDTLAQGFASIVALGHAVTGELDRDPAAARRHIGLITATATENLAESRRIIAAMTPGRLAGATLTGAVERTIDSWRVTTGIAAALVTTGEPSMAAPAIDVVALRVVQESLENIRKHAGAREVTVGLHYDTDQLEVTVTDDGQGFDPTGPTAGYGVAGMRSRVHEVGGDFTVTGRAGDGTTITARLPIGAAS